MMIIILKLTAFKSRSTIIGSLFTFEKCSQNWFRLSTYSRLLIRSPTARFYNVKTLPSRAPSHYVRRATT